MRCTRRKRLHLSRVLFLLSGVFLCTLYQLTISARLSEPWRLPQTGEYPAVEGSTLEEVDERTSQTPGMEEPATATTPLELTDPTTPGLRPVTHRMALNATTTSTEAPPIVTTNHKVVHCIYVAPVVPVSEPVEPVAPEGTPIATPTPPPGITTSPSPPGEAPPMMGEYPPDIFTVEDRRRGWVLLHIFGMMYMFVSLAVVCDEFFVPALGVITDQLAISDDVAGATFMAAGGSAPELFTSLIGVFIAHSNVGIGTIVGSAVFNILFVIGMCALVSKEMLHLTWWPLFRDVSFYILGLFLLIIFFLDNFIMWWESATLLAGYTLYVCFMKYNVELERAFKSQLHKHKNIVQILAVKEPDKDLGEEEDNVPPIKEGKQWLKLRPSLQRGGSSASLHNSTMRNSIFQLMIHTLDPLGQDEGSKPEQPKEPEPAPAKETEKAEPQENKKEDVPAGDKGSGGSRHSGSDEDLSDEESSEESDLSESEVSEEEEEEEEMEEPLSLEWPDNRRKQATFLFLLPIVFPLWLTIPDVRDPAYKKYFAMTFLASILWIGVFSYLMVWWAHQVGETIGISEEIMGLTILAAGTSIPDLITSVIVARKGLGDMAVSSSVGSNIFDITVGLPIPWLLYSITHGFVPVKVSSNGLFCAIILLFLMLLFVIISIACCNWKMNKTLGATMFLLYLVFLVLSVMLEDRIITCPVSI
ncbi:sodium/potassium/calcium exchanger 1 [Gadus morhua]|uniref:sodium/potassium/calcium exchanger 1 n=1 Tax=Gadus morhua TaxID=8049 RepID=UPI0011B53CA9|nr:sodium/potassium/calcium exchanger 1 [Gadus morhua]